jgi:hypothetical protein
MRRNKISQIKHKEIHLYIKTVVWIPKLVTQ